MLGRCRFWCKQAALHVCLTSSADLWLAGQVEVAPGLHAIGVPVLRAWRRRGVVLLLLFFLLLMVLPLLLGHHTGIH